MKKLTVLKSSRLPRLVALAVCLSASSGAWGCCSTCPINTGAPSAYIEYTYTDCDGVMHSSSAYAGSGSYTVGNCSNVTVTLVEHWNT